MIRDQFILDLQRELIVDNFAGGGGASCGIELALLICVQTVEFLANPANDITAPVTKP